MADSEGLSRCVVGNQYTSTSYRGGGREERRRRKFYTYRSTNSRSTIAVTCTARTQANESTRGGVLNMRVLSRLFLLFLLFIFYLLSYRSFIFGLHNHALLGIRIVFDTSQLFYNKLRREHPRLFIYLHILIIS